MLYLLSRICFADCTIQEEVQSSVVEIQSVDIPELKNKSLGCTTLIELWASWCKPCRDIKSPLHNLLSRYPSVYRLPISADYTAGALRSYLKRQNQTQHGHYRLSFWSVDGLKKEYARFGARFEGAIPFLILLSPTGEILYSATEPTHLVELEAVLKAHVPARPDKQD
ncbi:MAG: thioredoxin-like domain-containing protein [Myxococcota bacterium]|nr:thioredoxin-like domain-containing protein [Myxococcota bacterium]